MNNKTLRSILLLTALLLGQAAQAGIRVNRPWILVRNCVVVAFDSKDVSLDCPAAGGLAKYPADHYRSLLGEPTIGDLTGEGAGHTVKKKLRAAMLANHKQMQRNPAQAPAKR
jgi:hypothetical protein